MKVIDLLNKIANGEAPETISYMGATYDYDKRVGDYEDIETRTFMFNSYNATSILNDEVEIIEEDKKIEKSDFQTSQIPPWFRNEELIKVINNNFELQTQAIRLLIDEVNKLKENK